MVKATLTDYEAETMTPSTEAWLISRGFEPSGTFGVISQERDVFIGSATFSQMVPVDPRSHDSDHKTAEAPPAPPFADVEGMREWLRMGCPK